MMKLQLVTVLFAGVLIVDSLKVSIFYESLCPDSKRFITSQLYPTYYNISSAIEVDFVPYGKANHTLVDGSWQFECQHGEEECFGNKYQACALAQNYTQDTKVEFINCVMSATNSAAPEIISGCASQANVSFDAINQCFNSEGEELLAALGDRTHATENTQVFVPTVTYDDVFSQALQDQSLTNFAGVVCAQVPADQLVSYCERDNTDGSSAKSLTVNNGLMLLGFVALVHQWY